MVMRHAELDWYKPSFKTPLYPAVPILGLLGCLFVMGITSRPTILIGLGIIAGYLDLVCPFFARTYATCGRIQRAVAAESYRAACGQG